MIQSVLIVCRQVTKRMGCTVHDFWNLEFRQLNVVVVKEMH